MREMGGLMRDSLWLSNGVEDGVRFILEKGTTSNVQEASSGTTRL